MDSLRARSLQTAGHTAGFASMVPAFIAPLLPRPIAFYVIGLAFVLVVASVVLLWRANRAWGE